MNKPYLNESEAWREIARRIEDGEWRSQGLCEEVETLMEEGSITGATQCDMQDRIDAELEKQGYTLYLFGDRLSAKPRMELCLRFAAERAE